MNELFKIFMGSFFSGAIKFGLRFVTMALFMGFYFSRYFPTKDLLIVASFFLASFGLWKIFDYLDSKIDMLAKRFEG